MQWAIGLVVFLIATRGTEAKTSWSDCSAPGFSVTNVSWDPAPAAGGSSTVTFTGTSDATLANGTTFDMSINLGSLRVVTKTGVNACAPDTISLPLGMGSVVVGGFPCPDPAGIVTVTNKVTIGAGAPTSAPVEITFNTTKPATADSAAGEALCVKVTVDLSTNRRYARGYKRMSAPNGVEVANITDEMVRNAPDAIDWSEKGATTPIKNQGMCGSCWAFSTTEGVESAYFMANGKLPPPLSTQQIISCDKQDGGCDGGDLPTALKYLENAGGEDTASDYPDKSHVSGATGKCNWDKKEVTKVASWKYAVPPCTQGGCKHQDENKLAAALAQYGPLSICLNAASWDNYMHGIYTKKCSSAAADMDHCVQLVGYDKTQKYWKVRNSWEASWGEKGFIRLPMGKNACGVANEAVIISVDKNMDSLDLIV